MTDEYAGDDLTGLSEAIGTVYDDLVGIEEPPTELLVPDTLDDEWTVARMVTTMVPLLIVLSVLQMVSGSVLDRFEAVLVANPSVLILVPVQIGAAGNLGSILCSRLSTQFHLGTVELSLDNPDVRANVGAIMGLGLTVFTLAGIATWAIGHVLGGTLGLGRILTISMVSGMVLVGFVVVTSLAAVSTSYHLGYNPDDTTIPIVTNICDVAGVLILFAIVAIVL